MIYKILISCVFIISDASKIKNYSALFGPCKTFQFQCTNGQCIDTELLCDGKPDCADQSDETMKECSQLTCPTFSFKCAYGACIHLLERCNGIGNCLDNSDEINCTSNSFIQATVPPSPLYHKKLGKYICQSSGETINEELICDGKPDCPDQSDEIRSLCSDLHCPYFTFRCKYGACISLNQKCNDISNCVDGSDEISCFAVSTRKPEIQTTKPDTGKKLFQCNSGEFIDEEFLCDGEANCRDQSDETFKECSDFHCPHFSYKCNYGACVLSGARCNGVKECADNSDEELCSTSVQTPPLKIQKFECNSGQTIDAVMLCDGNADCTDLSDESSKACTHINCPYFTYRCNYGACVHGSARCNGFTECIDNSDEALCPTSINNKGITDQVPFKDYLPFT